MRFTLYASALALLGALATLDVAAQPGTICCK